MLTIASNTIYITDLDGTLLGPDAAVSKRSQLILKRLIENGVLFSVATARSSLSTLRVLEGIPLRHPIICRNGVNIHDPRSPQTPFVVRIPDELSHKLISLGVERGFYPLVYRFDGGSDRVLYVSGTESEGVKGYLDSRKGYDNRFFPVKSASELLISGIDYICFIEQVKGDIESSSFSSFMREAACEDVSTSFYEDVYTSGEYWLEFYSSDASKRSGALYLKEHTHADRLITFGDNTNDIPMLTAADESCAVSNATEAVLGLADHIIGSSAQDSVPRFIAEREGIDISDLL